MQTTWLPSSDFQASPALNADCQYENQTGFTPNVQPPTETQNNLHFPLPGHRAWPCPTCNRCPSCGRPPNNGYDIWPDWTWRPHQPLYGMTVNAC
jgi:hypothetical protein